MEASKIRKILTVHLLFTLLLLTRACPADQETEDSISKQPAPRPLIRTNSRYFHLRYSNDALAGTDRYFTQGTHYGYFDPILRHSPLMWPLLTLPGNTYQSFGLFIRWDGFTPTTIESDAIIEDERPFSSFAHLSHIRTSLDPTHQQSLTTELKLGFIGPRAGAEETQREIHRFTDGQRPRGWQHQLRHDLVADYQVTYRKQLWRTLDAIELSGFGQASLGTLFTHLALGPRLQMGRFYGFTVPPSKDPAFLRQLYLEVSAEARLVGYNATLQGGLFQRHSPHELSDKDIRRLLPRLSTGVVAEIPGWEFRATITTIGREYHSARSHTWLTFEFLAKF